jgi:hypothetical protein
MERDLDRCTCRDRSQPQLRPRGFAVGAHQAARLENWRKVRLIVVIFTVAGAFFAFVVGGWIAARLAEFRRAEPALFHGAMAWLLTVPFLLALSAVGGVVRFGTWYGGLTPPLATAAAMAQDPQFALVMRSASLAAVTALLLGLVGSVLGGWMASGEPMTFGYHRGPARGLAADLGRPRRSGA